ncbi:MAG: hypothetical protein CMK35_06205 [Porticoccaceae bacterium]|nr:hypothetical protein [Porticoccaceae bacterium]
MYNYASFMIVFMLTNCFLGPLLFYQYDKIISANIYVRLIHGVGCIDYLIPVMNKYPITILDFDETPVPEEVVLIFDRSISYFVWDCFWVMRTRRRCKLQGSIGGLFSLTRRRPS